MYTRSRSRGGLTAATSVTTQLYHNAASTESTQPGQLLGTVETMDDVETPGFRRRSSAGEMVNSPMVKTRLNVQFFPRTSKWIWVMKPGYTFKTGDYIGFVLSDPMTVRYDHCTFPFHEVPPWNENLAGIALAEARSRAASPDAALLVTLGELQETIGLMDHVLKLLTREAIPFWKLQRRYRNGELKPSDFLRELSETWLMYRYGIMPLVYELEGYVKALNGEHKLKRETMRGKQATTGSKNWLHTLTSSVIENVTVGWKASWTDSYRATCVYEFQDDLQARLGLRLADVPHAVHELTRLSFVADWFVNLGEYISSLTLAARANVLLQCVSRRLDFDTSAVYSESGSKTQTTMYSVCQLNATGAQVLFSYTRKERRPYQINDVGTLSPRIQLNAKRVADAAALLATAFDTRTLRGKGIHI